MEGFCVIPAESDPSPDDDDGDGNEQRGEAGAGSVCCWDWEFGLLEPLQDCCCVTGEKVCEGVGAVLLVVLVHSTDSSTLSTNFSAKRGRGAPGAIPAFISMLACPTFSLSEQSQNYKMSCRVVSYDQDPAWFVQQQQNYIILCSLTR